MERPFAKYEGLGNDFIVLDARDWPSMSPSTAAALCDRHRGVGADGVLWVSRRDALDARLVIFNADGTRPEMCGNGVRCVAAWLADQGDLAPGQTLALETDAGPRPVRLAGLDPRAPEGAPAWLASVSMGELEAEPAAFASVKSDDSTTEIPVFFADAGNPHAVLFDPPEGAAAREALAALVRARTDRYPHGVNVEFVTERADGTLRASVHERGVGWTLACGTGACAAAAVFAARRGARVANTTVELDGGPLSVELARAESGRFRAVMTGPARRVFSGAVPAPREATR